MSLSMFGQASAENAVTQKPVGAAQAHAPKINPALSEDECKTAGGMVGQLNICNSGTACFTTDGNGKSHRVCISAKPK